MSVNYVSSSLSRCTYRQRTIVQPIFTLISANIVFTALIVLVFNSNVHLTPSDGGSTSINDGPSSPSSNGTGYYVTLCADRVYGPHRTGNQLFLLAAALYVARQTGRTLTMPAGCRWSLDQLFQTDAVEDTDASKLGRLIIERFLDSEPPPCPCRLLMPPEGTPFIHGDDALDTEEGLGKLMVPKNVISHSLKSHGQTTSSLVPRTVELCGLYQTHRYADLLGPDLRRILQFQPRVLNAARQFLAESRPSNWSPGSYTRVGLHVRRGDFTRHDWRDLGLTVIDAAFVHRVVEYFGTRHRRVQLVVATDDKYWISTVLKDKFRHVVSRNQDVSRQPDNGITDGARGEHTIKRKKLTRDEKKPDGSRLPYQSIYRLHRPRDDSGDARGGSRKTDDAEVSVVFSSGQSAAVDMAVIAGCDSVVISTGSFGWWAAWMANRSTTIYYSMWPRPGSPLHKFFNATRYFPDRWIPMQ